MTIKILQGDCLQTLSSLEEKSVNTCVTSPPYWGLRDYGTDDQLGLEATPEKFVENLVNVFREVRRVLCDDGTIWLNLGDSYCASHKIKGLKQKDIIGIPWRVAFALQADGWYLRQDIIWHKPNPMPESATDRCTKAHEYIFLLSKSSKYYYDNEVIREPIKPTTTGKASVRESGDSKTRSKEHWGIPHEPKNVIREYEEIKGANKRSVWSIPVKGYQEAHFATYPPELIKPCILAGCPEGGTVLDPFGGSGTTAQVASNLNRNTILCELNPEYVELTTDRLHKSLGMFMDLQKIIF